MSEILVIVIIASLLALVLAILAELVSEIILDLEIFRENRSRFIFGLFLFFGYLILSVVNALPEINLLNPGGDGTHPGGTVLAPPVSRDMPVITIPAGHVVVGLTSDERQYLQDMFGILPAISDTVTRRVDSFRLDQYEVSAGIQTGGVFMTSDVPVTRINFPESVRLCRQRGGRLPTEAEWEYAASGAFGSLFTESNPLPAGGSLPSLQQTRNDRSWANIYGMTTGVSEWVIGDENLRTSANREVVRGASFLASGRDVMHTGHRREELYDSKLADVGLRCAYDIP